MPSSYRENAQEDRSLLITGFANQIFAVDRATGQVRWQFRFGEKAIYREVELAIEDGVVIACTSEELVFLDYRSGHVHTRVPLQHVEQIRSVMLVDQGHLYISGDGDLSCYTNRGHHVWTQPFEGAGYGAVGLALPGNVRQADDIGVR